MITDKQLDETLVELLRTKRALEALRAVRKGKTKRCWRLSCENYRKDMPLHMNRCSECNEHLYEHGSEVAPHAAAKRASLDLTRSLAKLRKGEV